MWKKVNEASSFYIVLEKLKFSDTCPGSFLTPFDFLRNFLIKLSVISFFFFNKSFLNDHCYIFSRIILSVSYFSSRCNVHTFSSNEELICFFSQISRAQSEYLWLFKRFKFYPKCPHAQYKTGCQGT